MRPSPSAPTVAETATAHAARAVDRRQRESWALQAEARRALRSRRPLRSCRPLRPDRALGAFRSLRAVTAVVPRWPLQSLQPLQACRARQPGRATRSCWSPPPSRPPRAPSRGCRLAARTCRDGLHTRFAVSPCSLTERRRQEHGDAEHGDADPERQRSLHLPSNLAPFRGPLKGRRAPRTSRAPRAPDAPLPARRPSSTAPSPRRAPRRR